MKGDTRCIDGRLWRHDPQSDDPYLETDIGKCPDCDGDGCSVGEEWEKNGKRVGEKALEDFAEANHTETINYLRGEIERLERGAKAARETNQWQARKIERLLDELEDWRTCVIKANPNVCGGHDRQPTTDKTPPIVEKLARMICDNFGGDPDCVSYSDATGVATMQWETFVGLVWDLLHEIDNEFYGVLHGTHVIVPDPTLDNTHD